MVTWKANDPASMLKDNEDIITGWRLCCAFDDRTCQLCGSLDGRIFSQRPHDSLHSGCRCIWLPVLKIEELRIELPIGTRSSINGQVPANWRYHEWLLRTQSRASIYGAMGWFRSKLFLDGWLTPAQFAELQVTDDFKLRSLTEMRALAPISFLIAEIPLDAPDKDEEDEESREE